MSRNNDKAKSIDLGEESDQDDLPDGEREARLERDEDEKKVAYWNISQETRDHAIQMVMKLGGNLGISVEGEFKRGVFARKNINGIRQYISHKDDRETREIMILISTLNLMSKSLVPLFMCSGDDTEVMVPLLKLFLSLTRNLTSKKREALVTRVKEKPVKKETREECLQRVKKEKLFQSNAYEQISALISFKDALVCEEVFHIIYENIDEPISKTPKARTADDLKSIETFLFLICNLLQIQTGPYSLSTDQIHSRSLQNKLILILSKNDFFDLLILLCTTINEKGSTQWNVLVMEILHYLMWDRNMKDLAQASKHKGQSKSEFLQHQAQKNMQSRTANAGKFRSQIQNERNNRMASVQNSVDQRMSRFGGMIVMKSTATASSSAAQNSSNINNDQSKETKTNVPLLKRSLTGQSALHNTGTVGSQINSTSLGGRGKKRGKKCSFADPSKSNSSMQSINSANDVTSSSSSVNVLQASMKSNVAGGLGDEERQTNIVLADFLDEFLGTAFGELVFSMKNSWRRAEAASPQHDLLFYSLTTACLQYQKFSHLDSQRTHMASIDKGETSEPWVPDLKNITQCFDRMMISHPADTIKQYFDGSQGIVFSTSKNKSTGDVVVPMMLYKETISFLRIMLESEETAHNDIAMSAIYRIFYNPTTTERIDILPVLLKNWNTRSYSKAHMVALIELCHETLKLLDIAANYVHHEQEAETKLTKKEIKALGEGRDLNFAAARIFDKDEYFQRLTTSTTVAMYTKALEFYRENTPQLNHYIYMYLKRMKEHVIETDRDYDDSFDYYTGEEGLQDGLTEQERKKKLEGVKLSLGHMLFNIETLNIFSVILNDFEHNKNIEQLVQLIKCMVRKFGDLAEKNHLLFVEILLHQTFPIRVMTDIFSTYQAADLARNYKAHGKLPIERYSNSHRNGKNGKSKTNQSIAVSTMVYSSESDADSDALSKIARPVTKPTRAKGKKKSDLRDRIEKKRSSGRKKKGGDDDDDSSEDDRIDDAEIADLQANLQPVVSRSSRTSKVQWSSSEDTVLRRLYKLYAGSHSVFAMIAQDSSLIDLGGNKNAQKIEKRVQQLELHLELANMLSSSEEDEEREEGAGVQEMSSTDDSSDASVSEKSGDEMSEEEQGDDGEGKVKFPTTKPKKRKRKEKKEKKKEKKNLKKQKSKSKSNSKYFLNPDEDKNKDKDDVGDNNNDDSGNDDDMDVAASDDQSEGGGGGVQESPPSTWPFSSPAEVYSQSKGRGESGEKGELGTGTEKPFWEDDLDDEGEDENSFERRMSALAARGPGPEATSSSSASSSSGTSKSVPVPKKSLLKKKKRGSVEELSDDDSDNDLDALGDSGNGGNDNTKNTGGSHGRSSVLIDSDDDEE